MKTLKSIAIVALAAIMISSCGEKKEAGVPQISKELADSASYAVGVSFGSMLKNANFGELNYAEMTKAIKAVIEGKELKVNEMAANQVIQRYLAQRAEVAGAENKTKGEKFLAENKTKDSVQVTASGLQYKIINPGSAMMPVALDTVSVYYRGTLIDGTEFDSSMGNPEPVKFPVNAVIPGWSEGIQLIGEGGKIRLFIPSELAYGAQQAGPTIGPNSTLIFDVELVKIAKAPVADTTKTL
ncbi:MAG: peptidylprolyl isomerase [Bacteroidetes bacterium HGW-Bacteroidetes-10]|jgi:FKBP-type peptidyl-prolyl cis-trans isomerase FklB|nr:MAG: peptidylprolyl isomerase [Bacteroidetes bacterium HGW-Bacteroidetes-10]